MKHTHEMPPAARYPAAHRLPVQVRTRLVASVVDALSTNTAAVERAIAILFSRQTEVEKNSKKTLVDNGLGVRRGHSGKVTYYGKWLASGRRLNGHHLEVARKIALTYARTQLMEVAALKAGLI